MIALEAVCGLLSRIAPLHLAESWDNVGLLVGDRRQGVRAIMTCLTITPEVVEEAMAEAADLIVVHHPLPFKPLARITSDSTPGAMLLQLIAGGVAVYSAHTAFDSAAAGINQSWAESLNLGDIQPLVPAELNSDQGDQPAGDPAIGAGRLGRLTQPTSLAALARQAAAAVAAGAPRIVGGPDASAEKVAVACGSGASFLAAARRRGCDTLITGEASFHSCLEAKASGIGLVLLGHYHSERFAMEQLAHKLQSELPDLKIWASERERDPIAVI